jgi:hypothetical protein
MFHLSVRYASLNYSHPTRRELRRRVATLTHMPTGRRWAFNSRRAALAARAALTEAVSEGRLSILPPVPLDADCEPVAA